MTNTSATTTAHWRPETELVHGGILRSQWGETSEAMFLTQGFVYDSAEQAEARFKNEDPGFQYSRFGNPTVSMFEERLRLFEGAEECRATATGMAAVTAAILSYVKTGDHIVSARALFGSCRYIVETLCPRFGIECTLIDGNDLDAWQAAIRPNTKMFFFETPSNPTLELVDIEAVTTLGKKHGILTVVDNVFATPMLQRPLEARRRHRRLFDDQAHRRPGPLPRRRGAVLQRFPHQAPAGLGAPDRPVDEPVQRLGDAQGSGDHAAACQGAVRDRGPNRRLARGTEGCHARALSRPRRSSASSRWPQSRCRAAAR